MAGQRELGEAGLRKGIALASAWHCDRREQSFSTLLELAIHEKQSIRFFVPLDFGMKPGSSVAQEAHEEIESCEQILKSKEFVQGVSCQQRHAKVHVNEWCKLLCEHP